MALRMAQCRALDADHAEVVGSVLRRIAHDFNNLLLPSLAYPRMLKEDLPPDSQGVQLLTEIEGAAGDMAHITSEIQDLLRKRHGPRLSVDVNEILRQATAAGESSLPPGVHVTCACAEELPRVPGYPDEIAAAVQHVFRNAVEALSQGTGSVQTGRGEGLIVIGSEALKSAAQSDVLAALGLAPVDYVKVTVRDNGPGVAPEIADKIFDLFVTDKKGDGKRGAGLGLSIVYRTVLDHGGKVGFDSVPGRGAEFCLFFPAEAV
jgi:two-component system, cell cycle sensor histidine kinase and response regulator CckA